MRDSTVQAGIRYVALLLVAFSLSGCVATLRGPAVPPPIRLFSPQDFTLYATDVSTGRLVPSCVVRHVDASVLGIRGDTLLLSDVQVVAQSRKASPCATTDSLRLLLASDTLVKAERLVQDGVGSILLSVLLVPVSLIGLLAVAFILGGGPST